MLQIKCSGTTYEIGHKHGTEAKLLISRSISFYADLFQQTSRLPWDSVQSLALQFEPTIREKWPAYLEEMSGIAEASNQPLAAILALNVRTEIAFGCFSDGCTALSWKTESGASYLAQNWDWMEAQKENLVLLSIRTEGKPRIKMVTEAGIIGKIGLNDAGVGVCLNAIRAKGMDERRLPCHLGLRMVLESRSRAEAVERLEKCGIASACHMLIADSTGGVGMEWSSVENRRLDMNASGQVFHSNHYVLEHKGVEDEKWLEDSSVRIKRIEELCKGLSTSEPSMHEIKSLFKDEENCPGAICRQQLPPSNAATLFNVVMDLTWKRAVVALGRPVKPDETIELSF